MSAGNAGRQEHLEQLWKHVEQRLEEAVLIEWDGCHAIHLHTVQAPEKPLSVSFARGQLSKEEMLEAMREWFDHSCPLRFISEVRKSGGIVGSTPLIAQGDPAN